MSEPIDIRKLADFGATALVKSTSQTSKGLLVIIVIGLLGFSVYKAYIKRPEPTQTQKITIEKGGTATIVQKAETQRKWVFFFIEPFVEQRQHNSMQTGIRTGIRIEW